MAVNYEDDFEDPNQSPRRRQGQQPPEAFVRDYWAPDREQVLSDPSRWGPSPSAPSGGGASLPPSPPSYTTPGSPANTGIGGAGSPVAPPSQAFNQEGFRQQWLGSGGRTPQDLANFVNQGGYGSQVQILGGKGDKIRLPNGQIVDAVFAAGLGGQGAQWLTDDGGGDSGWRGGAGMAGGAAGGQTAFGGDPQMQGAFRDMVLKLMAGGDKPVDANDPASVAYRRARTRGAGEERASAAERAAFMGLNPGGQGSGAFETNVQGINEAASEDIAGFEANQAIRQYQDQRREMMQAIELANSVGARQEAQALQWQLGQLDNQFRYASLGQNQRQFEDRTAFDYADLQGRSDRDAYLAALGG